MFSFVASAMVLYLRIAKLKAVKIYLYVFF